MLNRKEYNAMLHAIWRLDNLIKSSLNIPDEEDYVAKLQRDRDALSNLFNRLTEPPHLARKA